MTFSNQTNRMLVTFTAAVAFFMAAHCHAELIYSGTVNIPIPTTGSGVYLNVFTGVHSDSAATNVGWDVQLLTTSTVDVALIAAPGTGYMRNQGVGDLPGRTRLDRNILVGTNSVYYGNSTATIGELPGQWRLNSVGTLGFKFSPPFGETYYGWMRIQIGASAAECTVVDYAFEKNSSFFPVYGLVAPCTPSFVSESYQVDDLACDWTYRAGLTCINPPSSPQDFHEIRYFDGSALYGGGWVIRGPYGWISTCYGAPSTRNGVASFDVGLSITHNSKLRIEPVYSSSGFLTTVRDANNIVIAELYPTQNPSSGVSLEAGTYRLSAQSPSPTFIGAGNWSGDGIRVTASLLTLQVPAQYPTIQAAIDAAPATGGWCVEVGPGIYNEAIDFKGKSITVKATGAQSATVIDGTGLTTSVVRAVTAETPATVLDGFTIRNGSSGSVEAVFQVGGAMFIRNASPTIRNCAFVSNHAGYGGAIYALYSSALIERCSMVGNTADFDGGGLQANQSAVQLFDVQIEENYCGVRGGGLHLVQGQPQLTRVRVEHNRSGSIVGGVSWFAIGSKSSAASMFGCSIVDNVAESWSGGIGISAEPSAGPSIGIAETTVCRNFPLPNVAGDWLDNGQNTVCFCDCDIFVDGTVDAADLGILLAQWGPRKQLTLADFNRDGVVNGADLTALLIAWGPCLQ